MSEIEFKKIIDEIYSTPRSRKWKYHKDYPKYLALDSSDFSDFISDFTTKDDKNAG